MAQPADRTPKEMPEPVLPFDWPWDRDETIWPCRHCSAWRAELRFLEPDDAVWVREWHANDCRIWDEIQGLHA